MAPYFERPAAAEQERVPRRAVETAFATCGAQPGAMLTEEHVKQIARSMAEDVTPLIIQRLRQVQPPWKH